MSLDTVLVAVGPGEPERTVQLIETLTDVAGPSGATVVLAHAFTRSEYREACDRLRVERGTDPTVVAGRLRRVTELAEPLERAGVDTEVAAGVGEHAPTIVRLAREHDADLAFVGGERRSPAGKVVFGSTAQYVLLNAPCPVTLVRDDQAWDG